MRLQFVTIGQNVNWPRGRLSLARKKNMEGNLGYNSMTRITNTILSPSIPNPQYKI